jgi:hypothetical protein
VVYRTMAWGLHHFIYRGLYNKNGHESKLDYPKQR